MYDIPFVRFALPVVALYLFFYYLVVNPLVLEENSGKILPEEAQQMRQIALLMMERKKFQEALEPLQTLHEAFPDSHIYQRDLAEIHHALGEYAEEAAMWELFLQHSPTPVEACPQISHAYLAMGKREDAFRATRKCYEYDTTNSDSVFFYAHELERRGQTDEARQLYAKGHELAPEYPDISIGLARTLSSSGQNQQARKLIDMVLKKLPGNVDALVAAGLIYARGGQRATALRLLREARKLSPGYREIDTLLAGVNRNLYANVNR